MKGDRFTNCYDFMKGDRLTNCYDFMKSDRLTNCYDFMKSDRLINFYKLPINRRKKLYYVKKIKISHRPPQLKVVEKTAT